MAKKLYLYIYTPYRELDRNWEDRVDGVLEELMDEGGQGGCRSSRRCQAI